MNVSLELRMSAKKDFKKSSHSPKISDSEKLLYLKLCTVTWKLFDILEFEYRFLNHNIDVLFRKQCIP